MSPVLTARRAANTTFRSLLNAPSFRRYYAGQAVSLTGTWVHQIASAWLVLQLSDSALALGLQTALTFLPILLFGAWGGLVADRFDRRKILLTTQSSFALLAFTLGALTAFGVVELWMVFVLSLAQGIVTTIDNPTRQSFYADMVRPKDLPNAISLNSALVTGTRILGPALAGVLIAGIGLAPCFLLNGVSYIAVLISLHSLRRTIPVREARADGGDGSVREGLRYVRRTPELLWPLVLMAVLFTFSFNLPVLLPLLASRGFGGSAGMFGVMMSLVGLGALVGSLVLAHRPRPGMKMLGASAVGLGALSVALAWTPSLRVAAFALVPLGVATIAFMITGNATVQLHADEAMRGRVMGLFSVVFLGSTPIGAPIAGFLAQHFGPRIAITIGGSVALIAGGLVLHLVRRNARARQVEDEDGSAESLERAEHLDVPVAEPGDAPSIERISA